MIKNSKKLKVAFCLLLIVQKRVIADGDLNCLNGIKIDEKDGWGPDKVGVPASRSCNVCKACLRLEVDEIGDPNGEMC